MTDSLLSRLQALTEPNREIDAEIALANGWKHNPGGLGWQSPGGSWLPWPPRYTASIDAALTLVQEGRRWEIWSAASGIYHGEVWPLSEDMACAVGDSTATPAIALLIAILKAKEST